MKLPLNDEKRLMQGSMARGRGTDWVLRYVHAKYGNDPSGTAVFRESFIARSICVTTSYLCQASPSWSVRFSVATLAVSLANWITRGAR